MADSFDPYAPDEPFDEPFKDPRNDPFQEPFGDPWLDAVERSIEQPPAAGMPLGRPEEIPLENPAAGMDEINFQIENSPPDSLLGSETWQLEITAQSSPETEEPQDKPTLPPQPVERRYGSFNNPPPVPRESHHRLDPPNPPHLPKPRLGGGGKRQRPGSFKPKDFPVRGGGVSGRKCCLDRGELINVEECESCDKYRHWPEGTDEEPRECWHEWSICRQVLDEICGEDNIEE